MAESDQRSTVTDLLRQWDAVAVENPVHPGTPDVNCILGWLELKWLRSWPVNDKTVVRLDHFSKQQRVWLARRWARGGSVWLLLQCGEEWLLFDGATAAQLVGKATENELVRGATHYWSKKPTPSDLAKNIDRHEIIDT